MSLYTDASLIMFPSGYKEDKIYSLKPTDGSGDLTFTRASTATRVNADGLIETSPVNLLEQSESIGTSPWTTPNVSVTSGQTDPNGGSTAFLVVESTDGGSLRQAITQTGQLCYSIILKYSSGVNKNASLFCTDASQQAGFNLEDGTIAYVSGSTATIESLGNGWYKCAMTFTPSSASTLILFPNYESGIGAVFAWHPQLNIGSTAKPYFPTTDRLNVPRIDYTGGGCGSLLLEKQSTNLVTYSEQFDNAAWNKEDLTVTANNAISPNGTQNADLLLPNTSTIDHSIYQTTTTGDVKTFSTFAKAGGYTFVFLGANNGVSSDGVFFNLSNGTISQNTSSFTATITNCGNGWYRCTISTSFWPLGYAIICTSANGISFVHAGNGTSGVYVYGAQLEASSYPTSYIPTLASSVTRLADSASKTGISSLIGQTQGTMFVEFNSSFFESYTQRIFNLSDGTPNNAIGFQLTTSNQLVFYVENGGTNQVVITKVTPAITLGNNVKIAAAYANNDFVFYVNGTQIGTDTSGSVPATSELRFSEANASAFYRGLINQAIVFPTRLTNTQLESLTSL